MTPARTPPLIGVVLDWEAPTQGQNTQRYLLRQHYCDAIIAAGGQPLAIPYGPAGYIPPLLDTLDGLVVPRGDYPIPHAWNGEGHAAAPHPPT
ncbi:MAG: gamma-glutamyl-gamma-aminobutyrate hydrolase family protein, partial [Candidatus Competibacterales bacterium]